MKKSIIFLIILLLTTKVKALECIDNYTNSNNIKMTCEQFENLKNQDFSDLEIETMDLQQFNENKNLKGQILMKNTKYYKVEAYYPNELFIKNNMPLVKNTEITQSEYESISFNDITTMSPVNTNYKTMTTSIINPNNGNYRYKNSLQWKKIPKVRSYDIIGIGIESNKVYGLDTTKNLRAIFSYEKDKACKAEIVTTGTWSLSPNGYSVKFKLPFKSYDTWTALNINMYFDVRKTINSTINVLNAYGNYRHATSIIPDSSFSFSITAFGIISIGGSYESNYDTISTSQATLTGLNW